MTAPALKFHRTPMKRDPVNVSFLELVDQLRVGCTCVVHLEPGDATRYDFIIARPTFEPIDGARLIVVRTNGSGGEMRAAGFVWSDITDDDVYNEQSVRAIKTLADGNEWSEQLFTWWFRDLWAAIEGES